MYNPVDPWSTVEYSKVSVQYATYYDEIPIPILYEVVTVGNKILPPRPKKNLRGEQQEQGQSSIWTIVFYEHELIVHVIQGLSLSTASVALSSNCALLIIYNFNTHHSDV